VAEWLKRLNHWLLALKVLSSRISRAQDFAKASSVHPAGNRYPVLFIQSWVSEGDEEDEWHPASITPSPVQVGSLTSAYAHGKLSAGSFLVGCNVDGD